MLRKVIYLIPNSCFLTGYTQVSSSVVPVCVPSAPPPKRMKRCKLSKARQASSYVAEYTACIPQRAVMSPMHKLWESVIQGQENKAANRDSKYITAHFSPPELNWQTWISESGLSPSGNNSTHSTLEWRERRTAALWEPGRHLSDLRCLLHDLSGNWVGAGSLSCVCPCVFVMTEFFWASAF